MTGGATTSAVVLGAAMVVSLLQALDVLDEPVDLASP